VLAIDVPSPSMRVLLLQVDGWPGKKIIAPSLKRLTDWLIDYLKFYGKYLPHRNAIKQIAPNVKLKIRD
jgi:hypothetical protein